MALALIDMDGTVIDGDTNNLCLHYYLKENIIDKSFLEPLATDNDIFTRGSLSMPDFCTYLSSIYADLTGEEFKALLDTVTEQVLKPQIKPGALKAVEEHHQKGDLCIMVTSTVSYVAERVAALTGIDEVIASGLVMKDGVPTDTLAAEVPYRENKVKVLKEYIKERGLSFEGASGYGDSVNDLPMLSLCAHRYAVDADPKLRAHPDFKTLTDLSWR